MASRLVLREGNGRMATTVLAQASFNQHTVNNRGPSNKAGPQRNFGAHTQPRCIRTAAMSSVRYTCPMEMGNALNKLPTHLLPKSKSVLLQTLVALYDFPPSIGITSGRRTQSRQPSPAYGCARRKPLVVSRTSSILSMVFKLAKSAEGL